MTREPIDEVAPRLPAGPALNPKWIWSKEGEDVNRWAWARRRWEWNGEGAVRLRVSADLRAMVWLNGVRLGFGPPKFHALTPTVDVYELEGMLRKGTNLLAIQVYSLGFARISSCMPRRGGLWVSLDGGEQNLVSDSRWKMRLDPGYLQDVAPRGEMQPPTECFDARCALGHPEREDYDDSAWSHARELDPLDGLQAMEPRDIPFMTARRHAPDRVIERGVARHGMDYRLIKPAERAALLAWSDNLPDDHGWIRSQSGEAFPAVFDAGSLTDPSHSLYALLDFGRIWTGYPYLIIRGTPGTLVDLSYSEDLKEHRIRPDKSIPYHDRIILGEGELEHRITWPKCLRYLQINVQGGRAELREIGLERSHYPVTRNGFFSSDRPVMDQAVEISLHTVEIGMEDSFMDTPWRERGSWLGDDLIKAQTAYSYFQDYALARRFLLHHARGQHDNGMMRGKYPGNVSSDVSTWTLRYPPSVIEYCAESGDWAFGGELWPVLDKIAGWLGSLQTPSGLFQAPSVHVDEHTNRYNFIDWSPVDMRGINAAWNAFAAECLRGIEVVAGRVGHHEACARISALRQVHRKAFQDLFWDEERGIFVNGLIEGKPLRRWGCQENCLAVLFDLATEPQRARIIRRLESEGFATSFEARDEDYDIEVPACGKIPTVSLALSKYRWPDDKMVPIGTPYFAAYLIETLCKCGLFTQARQLIEERWGEFSRQGGTSVWETWNQDQSLSHGWSAFPSVFAARHLLGVRRNGDLGEEYEIIPQVAGYQKLRGRVATRAGLVQVEWSEGVLQVDVPEGLRFSAGLPLPDGARLLVNGLPTAPQRFVVKGGLRHALVEIPAGRHHLQSADS